jgi:cytochrome c-type biogenesis protein CcmH
MIRSIVERLSERLKANGDDPDGWVRLVRSYTVLGDRQMASAAASDARRALTSSPDKLATFEDGLKTIGATMPSASAATTPPQHDATMQAMVDKLAERLSKEGGDVDNWFMLVRSYVTLGESGRAAEATAQARRAFASDPQKLALFDQLVNSAEAGQAQGPGQPAARQNPVAEAAAPDQQMAMIEGMVAGLAERLKQDGHDVDGWIRLMRSYVVLGQGDKAVEAGKNARLALSNDPESLRRINDAAKALEIDLP